MPNLIKNLLVNIAVNVRCAAVAMLDTSMSHKNPNIKTCSNLFGYNNASRIRGMYLYSYIV